MYTVYCTTVWLTNDLCLLSLSSFSVWGNIFAIFGEPVNKLNRSKYGSNYQRIFEILPFKLWGGGTVRPPPRSFCPLLKISLGNPYLKILDLTKLYNADAPMKKKNSKKFSFTSSQSTLIYGSENRPWPEGLKSRLNSIM